MRAMTIAAALLLALPAIQVHAGSRPKAANAPLGAEAVIPMSRQIDFVSTVNGRRYRIQIAMPGSPPPANGFGVLYVLDGDGYFGTYAGAVRLRAMAHEIEPVIVVGIGYPDAAGDLAVTLRRRQFDLTPTDADDETKAMAGSAGESPLEFGGADAFLQVIETEIKPKVAAMAPVDAGHDVLFGHSLGGLFVLHALFRHPTAFRAYLALSPSIWWNHRAVLDAEGQFARSITGRGVAPRVMLAVGGNEQQLPPPPYPPGLTREALEALVNRAAMVDNVRGLSDRLASLQGATGYQVRTMVFDGESHNSVAWRSVNAFLDFAFAPTAPR
jgi:predicted alpha/beta superfamily hydrolase